MSVELVAEMTTNHFGHLRLACKMAEAAAAAGASAVKMQAKNVDRFYSREKLATPFKSPFGSTYGDYRRIFEFGPHDWREFSETCKWHGIPWFVTAQDEPSLEMMLTYNLPRYKIASSNARNWRLLRRVQDAVPHDREIVLSVAGSTLQEIDKAASILGERCRLWLLHCVAEYPCPHERLRLGNIPRLIQEFACDTVRIGYSGHEQGLAPSLATVDLGAEMIERHFCLSRHSFVHHIECSLEPHEFAELARLANGPAEARADVTACLPKEAFREDFGGMTEQEEAFLRHQTYGRQFLDGGSVLA